MPDILTPEEIMFSNWQPKVVNQFIMYIEGIPTFLINMADRPKLENGTVTLDHINVQRYVKGKSRWTPVNISLYDPIVPSGAQAAMEWIRLSHESVTGRDGYADFYKKTIILNGLGPVGDKVEQWTLKGAWVSNFDGGTFDWSGEEALKINLTLTYDFAILEY